MPEEDVLEISHGWTQQQKDAWWDDRLGDRCPFEVTHEVVYRPTFRIKVGVPPWLDPDEVLGQCVTDWSVQLVGGERPNVSTEEWLNGAYRVGGGHADSVHVETVVNDGSESEWTEAP